MKNINARHLLYFLLFLAICYFPIFWKLDSLGMQMWDESRNAVSTVEMMRNGNLFVRHYYGVPDVWETKPTLLMWLQMPFVAVLGIKELAFRLPSALATLGICLYLVYFFRKNWRDTEGGVFAALALITSSGFISYHVSRTGDHDALVSFFLTVSTLSY